VPLISIGIMMQFVVENNEDQQLEIAWFEQEGFL
jgi:hypothetical protein